MMRVGYFLFFPPSQSFLLILSHKRHFHGEFSTAAAAAVAVADGTCLKKN